VTGTPQAPTRRAVSRRAVRPDGARDDSTAVDADRVFAALADPRRRELLELLAQTPGCSASSLAAGLPISRQAVAQHLSVLEDSSLVSRRRAGREVLFSVRPDGLTAIAEWLTGRAAVWRKRLEHLGQQAASDRHN
jgi:DNA-binding transcriptional ArsR family regulator